MKETERPRRDAIDAIDAIDRRYSFLGILPFASIHAVAIGSALWLGWSWKGFALAVAMYYVRMFGVTAGYHRYFAHRTFKTSRAFQFFLALLASLSMQKGVCWWAAHHRAHHKYSDAEGDIHSMKRDGFFWSHMGWLLSQGYTKTDTKRIPDLVKYPELVWFDRWYWVPPLLMTLLFWGLGGWWALTWGVGVSTVMLWHGTFTINSLSHWMGRVRYKTRDESKNSLILAIVTMGEGWHNTHHYYQRATNQGFFWWEIDATFYVLKVLSWVGLVWDLHTPPAHVLAANRVEQKKAPGPPASDPALGPIAIPLESDAE